MAEEKEKIDAMTDMVLFWADIAGKKINFKKVAEVYGKETAERLQREIGTEKK